MRRLRIIAVVFGALALFGACANDDDPTVEAPEATTEATEAPEDGAAGGIEAARTVQVAETDLGDVLVDENQHTLYLFKQDTGEDSTCTGGCAQTWPALKPVGEPTAGDGVDEAKISTNDAGQVVYNGHPLYTYSGDQEPGDTNGQGVGDNWYAVSPEGEAIEE